MGGFGGTFSDGEATLSLFEFLSSSSSSLISTTACLEVEVGELLNVGESMFV